ncbi:MAG: response regulator transcription factor [Prolixibacteraceae bacterium]|jgi:DNA-binding NarL/FixJ family response regulator|nr:response regulator transcription factor [Prolixibacteraceae bacterium]
MEFRIAIAEDNAVNRNTFMQKLSLSSKLRLIFSANNGNECLEKLKGLFHTEMPQVIFMDLKMPEMDGIETIRIAKSLYPQIHFIVLTIFDDDSKIFDAIKAGASGYLLKHEPASVLEESVIDILETGGAPMSPAIARKALQLLSRTTSPENEAVAENEMPGNVTQREKEILQNMVSGWDAKRIAAELNISTLTVRKHIANIYEKLHVNSRAQVIMLAQKHKWL